MAQSGVFRGEGRLSLSPGRPKFSGPTFSRPTFGRPILGRPIFGLAAAQLDQRSRALPLGHSAA